MDNQRLSGDQPVLRPRVSPSPLLRVPCLPLLRVSYPRLALRRGFLGGIGPAVLVERLGARPVHCASGG